MHVLCIFWLILTGEADVHASSPLRGWLACTLNTRCHSSLYIAEKLNNFVQAVVCEPAAKRRQRLRIGPRACQCSFMAQCLSSFCAIWAQGLVLVPLYWLHLLRKGLLCGLQVATSGALQRSSPWAQVHLSPLPRPLRPLPHVRHPAPLRWGLRPPRRQQQVDRPCVPRSRPAAQTRQ